MVAVVEDESDVASREDGSRVGQARMVAGVVYSENPRTYTFVHVAPKGWRDTREWFARYSRGLSLIAGEGVVRMYIVTDTVAVPAHEVWFEFDHAPGPGGQHVNKTATRATLCFHLEASPVFSPAEKRRLATFFGRRIGADGVLRLVAAGERSQSANRRAAEERFVFLVAEGIKPRTPRIATRPTRASQERRRQEKRRVAQRKSARKTPQPDDDE